MSLSFNNTQIAFAHLSNMQLRKSFYLFKIMNNNYLVNVGTSLTNMALAFRLPISPFIRPTFFNHFCGGETLDDSKDNIAALGKYNVKTLLDYSVEGKETDTDFDHSLQQLLAGVAFAQNNMHVPVVVAKITGMARLGLLEQYHAGETLQPKQQKQWVRLRERLHTLCKAAQQANVILYFDAEESWIQIALDDLISEMMRTYNREKAIVYNTVQLYRHDRLAYLKVAHKTAQKEGYFLGVKLVRGAYMEKERQRAKDKGYPSPIQPDKAASDHDFDAALSYCIDHIEDIAFCCASHNEVSNLYLCELMQNHNIPPQHPHIWFAQLYGMSDNLSFNLAHEGYNVGKYLPYGPLHDVMPYLIRRAQENTSVAGQMSRQLQLLQKEMIRRGLKY